METKIADLADLLKTRNTIGISDVKYENGQVYASLDGQKIALNCSIDDEPWKDLDMACTGISTNNASAVTTATGTLSAVTTATSASASYMSDCTDDNIGGYVGIDQSNKLYTYPANGNWATIATYTFDVFTPYFLDKDENSSWIIEMFAPYYIDLIVASSGQKTKCVTIEFFGICDKDLKTSSVYVDVLSTSIKEIFKKACTQAKNAGFTELFGPITPNLTQSTYIMMIEETGKFYKEFYNEEKLIQLVKEHNIPLNIKITEKTQNQNDDKNIKNFEKSIERIEKVIDDYKKACQKKKDKAPFELTDEEDEDDSYQFGKIYPWTSTDHTMRKYPYPTGIYPWWEVRPQDLPIYTASSVQQAELSASAEASLDAFYNYNKNYNKNQINSAVSETGPWMTL